ncbi:MAG: msbA [Hydrocarboniphaga sp.]|uniref:lipid A export permease/ATP-binding protein MsbA n=1 Tax=Hydrocarboniphaga sp. TaxID=2033016 RepID=UPI00261001A8|nr:lipid A export permease/ATP-binding protein MsbA [Hydrocarboniphaga sp.]MDB5967700.1 msbA [Hydrocarboniphaga sp.]
MSPWAVYKRLLRYTAGHWKIFAIAAVGMALTASTEVGFMSLMRPLLDRTFVAPDPYTIRWLPWAIVALFIVRGVAGFTSGYGMSWIARSVVKQLRGELFEHMLRMPVRFYDRISSAQLVARLTYHVEQVAEAASNALTTVIKDGLTVVGLICWMFYLNWKLALFCMIVAPIIATIVRYVSKRFRRVSKRIQDNMGQVAQAAEESVSGQRIVKIHSAQEYEARAFNRVNDRARSLAMKIVATRGGSEAVIQFIAAWAVAGIVFFATQPDRLSEITPGTFVSFVGSMLALMNPMRNLGNVNERVQRGIAAAADIFKLMGEEQEPVGGTRPLERARGAIEFLDVRFRYRQDLPDALKGVSVIIAPGQTVAFVGRSGSGKSTLLSLIPRFYDVDGGAVLIDGHDLRDYPVPRLRSQIALVDQQVRLFNASVAENIAYGFDQLPPESELIAAAEAANAWEFIQKLPQGLNTMIGQNGTSLSGGQRQRLAIARALLKNAPILILDEATSALDTESERLIQTALDHLVAGRTTLVIAHRLSTVQRADRIVVMQDGRAVEQGRHEELLERGGIYASLYRMQFEEPTAVAV